MKVLRSVVVISAIALMLVSCKGETKEAQLKSFIDTHVQKITSLAKESLLAEWNAAVTGKSEFYDRQGELRLKLRQIYSSGEDFALLKQLKESGQITDPFLARQLDMLYLGYLRNQMDAQLLKEIVALGTQIEERFSTFRGKIDGEEITDNDITEILKTETDSARRKKAWLASKQVGAVVAVDIVKLVKFRIKVAKKLGFDNFHTLSLYTVEQDPEELDVIFDELVELTNAPYARLKQDLDRILSANCGISADEMMPWHYHDVFFQETPMVYELDLDTIYKGRDIKDLSAKFFDGLGLNVESILANSDLYEKAGKNPHAFCIDIDRQGDVRILCNIVDTARWMEVTLHELGHAVYFQQHDRASPYLLREPAHIFTTEAIAMFFGRLGQNPAWMQQMLGLSDEQRGEIEKVSGKYNQLKQIIFVRWAMVMYNFEKQLYANPDQDLNTLWWQMVEKYQFIKKPPQRDKPDWAAKIHFTIAPCYYHNYMLGELLASQLHHYLVMNVLKLESCKDVSYVDKPEVGAYLRKEIFAAGAIYHWNEMITRATGEPLTPKYFVREFVE